MAENEFTLGEQQTNEFTEDEKRIIAAFNPPPLNHGSGSADQTRHSDVGSTSEISPGEMDRQTEEVRDLLSKTAELRRNQDREADRVRFATSTLKRIGRTVGLGKSASDVIGGAVGAEFPTAKTIAKTIEDGAKVFQMRLEGVHSINRAVAAVGTFGGIGDLMVAMRNRLRSRVHRSTERGDITRDISAKFVDHGTEQGDITRNTRAESVDRGTQQGDITRHIRTKSVRKAFDLAYNAAKTSEQKGLVVDALDIALEKINARLPSKSKLDRDLVDPWNRERGQDEGVGKASELDEHHVAEQARVVRATTSVRLVARIMGIGKTATNVVRDAGRSADASLESLQKAADYKFKTTFARSLVKTLPERAARVLATGFGITDVNRKAMGMPTRQGDLTRDLRNKAHERAKKTMSKTADKFPEKREMIESAIAARGGERERTRAGGLGR